MRVPIKLVPNVLSASRLMLLPVLWLFALQGRPTALGIGLIIAGTTDVLDGFLARKVDAVSSAGAALDSLADNLLFLSVAAWLVLLRPDVVAYFGVWFAAIVTLHMAYLVVGMVRFRRFGNLHLYSAKVAAVAGFAFVVVCFLDPAMPVALGILAFSLTTVAVVEALVCHLILQDVDESFGSVFRALREQPEELRRHEHARRQESERWGGRGRHEGREHHEDCTPREQPDRRSPGVGELERPSRTRTDTRGRRRLGGAA